MDDNWLSEYAEELSRCLRDARVCAEACEQLLDALDGHGDPAFRNAVLESVIAPAAISRVLIDLLDQPAPLVLSAASLCGEAARSAADALEPLGDGRAAEAIAALQTCAASCAALVDAI